MIWSAISDYDLDLKCRNQCIVCVIPLKMPHLSVKFNEVCFGTFLSMYREVFWTLTPKCDLYLWFGKLNIMCDIPSNYGLFFVKFDEICFSKFLSNHRDMIWLPSPDCGLDLEHGNLPLECDTPSHYALSFCEVSAGGGGGRMVQWCWVNFQCRGVLQFRYSRARAYCACRRCGWGMFGHFYSHLSFLSSFSLFLGDGPI